MSKYKHKTHYVSEISKRARDQKAACGRGVKHIALKSGGLFRLYDITCIGCLKALAQNGF